MDLISAIDVAASGMRAQTARIKIISENMANVDSGPTRPGGEPYRRKTISFKNELDRGTNTNKVKVAAIGVDNSPFRTRFDPGSPMADDKGYVQMPNVNSLIESADMREAQRSYEANLTAIETSRNMIRSTLDLLR
jgi:flagellar basal-body rod protein FlgC